MVKSTKKEQRQSLLKSDRLRERVNKATFVKIESKNTKTFKYLGIHKLYSCCCKITSGVLGFHTRSWQRLRLLSEKIDWKVLFKDISLWLFEAIIEGATANFATHYLLGIELSPGMILAHGIVIKQGIDIFWRLRVNNGPDEKIFDKDE